MYKFLALLATLAIACGVQADMTPNPTLIVPRPSGTPTVGHMNYPVGQLRTYIVVGEQVNVRSGPGMSYPVIGYLNGGDLVVANCEINERWCILDLPGLNPNGLSWAYAPCLQAADGVCR